MKVIWSMLYVQANSLDNDGILVGNWSGNYENGKSPTSWVSTPAILEKYAENGRSVKFGQCWVFSAILTTSKCDKLNSLSQKVASLMS